MKTIITLYLITSLLTHCLAQDVLYLNDQSRVEGKLTDLTRERVSVLVNKGGSGVKFTFGADRVLAVVNRRGRFVCLDQLWYMPADQRTRLIEQFMAAREKLAYDMLIRQNPTQVLYGKVTAASGSGVTYQSLDGNTANVPKSELIGVFFRSGRHELIARAQVLCDKIDQMGGTFPPPTNARPVAFVTPRPAPTPVAEPPRATPKRPVKPRTPPKPNTPTPTPHPAEAAPAPITSAPLAAFVPIDSSMTDTDTTPTSETIGAINPEAGAGTSSNAMLTLSDAEYEAYRAQAIERVEDFGTLLGIIADKNLEAGQKDKAITEVLKMFKPDATIQVSSTTPGKAPLTLRMSDYLKRLKLLPYSSVSIEWTDVQFVQELTQRDDGNYYGKIRGEQRFTGQNQKTGYQYSDVTEKDVDVMLTPYKKQTEGLTERKWAVLLGNVGVVATN